MVVLLAAVAMKVGAEATNGECLAGGGSGAENDDDANISSASRRKLPAGGLAAGRLSAVFKTILGIPS